MAVLRIITRMRTQAHKQVDRHLRLQVYQDVQELQAPVVRVARRVVRVAPVAPVGRPRLRNPQVCSSQVTAVSLEAARRRPTRLHRMGKQLSTLDHQVIMGTRTSRIIRDSTKAMLIRAVRLQTPQVPVHRSMCKRESALRSV